MKKKIALICGVSGQDGCYLAQFLLGKGYQVVGTSRDTHISAFSNLETLRIKESILLRSMSLTDFRSVLQVLKDVRPDEIYNLAGQSSVGLSFELPVETLESISLGTLNLLESIRFLKLDCKLYSAGSGECFGETEEPADEKTAFRPSSPYAVAKAAAFWQVASYREAYGLYACSGILFNHESPLRPKRFVTQKIILAAYTTANESKDYKLRLGNVEIYRDWGWAPEYVEAMWLMLQQSHPEDYVIATGKTFGLVDFIEAAYSFYGLDWKKHVTISDELKRPTDHKKGFANPDKAKKSLSWEAKSDMNEVVIKMTRNLLDSCN